MGDPHIAVARVDGESVQQPNRRGPRAHDRQGRRVDHPDRTRAALQGIQLTVVELQVAHPARDLRAAEHRGEVGVEPDDPRWSFETGDPDVPGRRIDGHGLGVVHSLRRARPAPPELVDQFARRRIPVDPLPEGVDRQHIAGHRVDIEAARLRDAGRIGPHRRIREVAHVRPVGQELPHPEGAVVRAPDVVVRRDRDLPGPVGELPVRQAEPGDHE